MTWKEWKIWFKGLPGASKWFVILVLIRPLADNFYFLKNYSAILSPLYLIGVLTPVLCLYGMSRMPRNGRSRTDRVFGFLSFLILLSTLFLILADPLNLRSYEYLLKLGMPVYLFYFLRKMLRGKRDMDGILQAFLYSGLFVVGIFMYEVLVNPISVQVSRGLERVQGGFGDVMNYAIYITFGMLVMAYRYMQTTDKKMRKRRMIEFILVGLLCLFALFRINHTATVGIFGLITILSVVYIARANKGATFLILGLAIVGMVFFGWDIFAEKINPLVETDIAVYEGELETSKLLHGRVGRWQYCMEVFSEMPIYAQFLGMPLSMDYAAPFVGVGVHNDYLRMLFLTGFVGLITYVMLLFNLVNRVRGRVPALKFLCYGSFVILLLYSITTTPTFYPPFMYIQLSIFAYLSIPKKKIT